MLSFLTNIISYSHNGVCIFRRGHPNILLKDCRKIMRCVKPQNFRYLCKIICAFPYHLFCCINLQLGKILHGRLGHHLFEDRFHTGNTYIELIANVFTLQILTDIFLHIIYNLYSNCYKHHNNSTIHNCKYYYLHKNILSLILYFVPLNIYIHYNKPQIYSQI